MKLGKIIKDLLKKVWWWQPITLLLLIAVFGVYVGNSSNEKTDYVSEVNSEEDTLSIVESTTVYSGDEVRINEGEESVRIVRTLHKAGKKSLPNLQKLFRKLL